MTPLFLTVETGGTKILARLVDDAGATVAQDRWATGSPDRAAADLIGFVAGALPSGARIVAGGVAAFGPLDIDPMSGQCGRMSDTTKPGWTGSNLRRALQDALGVPIAIDTDVNAAALAEQRCRGDRAGTLAYITVGTGIGAGLVIAGETLKGAMHPELGHMRLRRAGGDAMVSQCPYHDDCAEGLAAGPAVRARIGADGSLADFPAARAQIVDYLAQFAMGVVQAWSPHRIVWGGGVMTTPGLLPAIHVAMLDASGGYGFGERLKAADFLEAARLEHAGLDGALLLARAAAASAHDAARRTTVI